MFIRDTAALTDDLDRFRSGNTMLALRHRRAAVGRHRVRRRIAAWLAIVAMTLHGWWPLVAHGKPKTFDLPREFCSAHGLAPAPYKTERPGPASPPVESCLLQDCPLCGTDACEWVAVESRANVVAPDPAQVLLLPFVAPRGESGLYLAPRPRGPPPIS